MSLIASILFNAPPPVFAGVVRTVSLGEPDDQPSVKDQGRRTYKANRAKRGDAEKRYAAAFKHYGGKASVRQIGEFLNIEPRHAATYIRKRPAIYIVVSKVMLPNGRPMNIYAMAKNA